MKGSALVTVLILAFIMGAAFAGPGEDADTVKTAPEKDAAFHKLDMKVRGILGKSCATSTCHDGEHPRMQLSLDTDDIPANMIGVPSRQNGEFMLIDTKDRSKSYLLLKLTGGDGMKGKKMPIMLKPLTKEEVSTVRMWLEELPIPAAENITDDGID